MFDLLRIQLRLSISSISLSILALELWIFYESLTFLLLILHWVRNTDKKACYFLNLCFNRDPSKRPTAAQLIEHSFVVKEYTPDAKTIEMIAQYRKNRRRLSENPSTEASQQVSDTENPDLDGEDEVGDLDSYDSYVA